MEPLTQGGGGSSDPPDPPPPPPGYGPASLTHAFTRIREEELKIYMYNLLDYLIGVYLAMSLDCVGICIPYVYGTSGA